MFILYFIDSILWANSKGLGKDILFTWYGNEHVFLKNFYTLQPQIIAEEKESLATTRDFV